MIATCEKCHTAFSIEDNLIKPGGTKFRCMNCKHVFRVHMPGATHAPAPVGPDKTQPLPHPPSAGPPENQSQKIKEKEDSHWTEGAITMVDFSEEAFEANISAAGQYEELGRIGEGGMGEVKLAKDTRLLRKVAVKELKKEAASSPAAVSYFIREAQITAQLDHPNIVPLYSVKEQKDGGNASFVMKLIKGQDLSNIITKARNFYKEHPKDELPDELNLTSRLGYFLKACDGLSYAHRKQVIHRDIKPANMMVGHYGEVYVMDWGIAKMIKEVPETLFGIQRVAAQKSDMYIGGTQTGSVVGTPGYISPEQVKGLPDVGPASDQFSMGVTLYELVTLRPARPGDLAKKLEWADKGIINQPIHQIPEKKIAPELKAIIEKATAYEIHDRYPDVSAMAEDVRRFLRGDEVSVLPDNLPRKMWRWMNKHRHVTAIVVLAALLIFFGTAVVSLLQKQSALEASRQREKILTRLLSRVAAQAHYIDTRFIRLEDLLVNLANNATYLIQNAPQSSERFYWISEFQDPKKGPPDLAHSSLYKKSVSVDYPVVKLSPNVAAEDVIPVMTRLAPLRHHFRKMMLDSRSSFAPLTDEEARRLITIHGLPVSWVYIGLEAGVMYSYPGKGTYADDYDPRVRPWYKLGAHKNAVYWGNPYIDIQGLGMVLPCATSLYDNQGRFYGVIGMDVTYNTIIQDGLTRAGSVGVVESFLLDDQGRIVVSSSQLGIALENPSADSALRLELFPVQDVVEKIRRKESGLVEVQNPGNESRLVLFHEIPSLNWYYVEEIRTGAILGMNK